MQDAKYVSAALSDEGSELEAPHGSGDGDFAIATSRLRTSLAVWGSSMQHLGGLRA